MYADLQADALRFDIDNASACFLYYFVLFMCFIRIILTLYAVGGILNLKTVLCPIVQLEKRKYGREK